jgi:dTMP kinase
MRHTFISIEGTDGSGKKTQIQKLYEHFNRQGTSVVIASFPNYESPSSGAVKMYLGGDLGDNANCLDAYQASTLFAADRLCTIKTLLNRLTEPTVVLFDRYVQSNMIHQAGKINDKKERDKFLKWIDEFEFKTLKLPQPDTVIFLDVPPEISIQIAQSRTAQKTGNQIDIHENDANHLFKAYEAAKYVADKFKWKTIDCVRFDKLKSVEEIHGIILDSIK